MNVTNDFFEQEIKRCEDYFETLKYREDDKQEVMVKYYHLIKRIQALPTAKKQVLILKYVYGYTYDQLEQMFGIKRHSLIQYVCDLKKML